MSLLLRITSALAGVCLSMAFFFSFPLFATEAVPMAHNHGAMINDSARAESPAATPDYYSRGQIKAWHDTQVTIAHTAIPALNWPPMTMTFALPGTLAIEPLPIGTSVAFSFRQTDQGYQLTVISAQQP
ncbi:hypothetical protein B7R74_17220 [Yersinia pseudotuberculosis]|uniref:Putative efflux system protein n=1 Tax=Yersinia pseudotuberculosis TaxID=633 RepID=A0A380QCW6_YERPU|nr:hypothetical protein B7R74_17220 [Yersinia pseudotuberculosis]SUP85989.1 putative efflux system protein [Yersinia pseudotuberculosis]